MNTNPNFPLAVICYTLLPLFETYPDRKALAEFVQEILPGGLNFSDLYFARWEATKLLFMQENFKFGCIDGDVHPLGNHSEAQAFFVRPGAREATSTEIVRWMIHRANSLTK